jgi:hypothetical protein
LSGPPPAWPPTTPGSGRSPAAFLPGSETPSAASCKPPPNCTADVSDPADNTRPGATFTCPPVISRRRRHEQGGA